MNAWVHNVGAADPSNPTLLLSDAMSSVLADSSVVAILSPQSRIMTITIQTTIDTIAGEVGASLASLAPELLEMVGATTVEAVAAVAGFVPFIGMVVSAVMLVVDDITGKEAAKEAAEAAATQHCQQEMSQRTPVGTGPQVMPCDIFGLYDAADIYELQLKGSSAGNIESENARPTLGRTLIHLTEDWPNGQRDKLVKFYQAGRQAAKKTGKVFAWGVDSDPEWKGDIPPARRALFRKLRLAMESARKHEPRGSTDGGASLWPIYLDLLKDEYAAGHLTKGFARFLLAYPFMSKGQRKYPSSMDDFSTYPPTPGPDACIGTAEARSAMIVKLQTDWDESLNPWYSTGAAKQKQWEEDAARIAAEVAAARGVVKGRRLSKVKGKRMIVRLPTKEQIQRKRVVRTAGGLGAIAIVGRILGFW